jgi:hypothetical protein
MHPQHQVALHANSSPRSSPGLNRTLPLTPQRQMSSGDSSLHNSLTNISATIRRGVLPGSSLLKLDDRLSRSLILGTVGDYDKVAECEVKSSPLLPSTVLVHRSDGSLDREITDTDSRRHSHSRNKSADASFFNDFVDETETTSGSRSSRRSLVGEQPEVRVFDSLDALTSATALFPNSSVIARRSDGNRTEFIVLPPTSGTLQRTFSNSMARRQRPAWAADSIKRSSSSDQARSDHEGREQACSPTDHAMHRTPPKPSTPTSEIGKAGLAEKTSPTDSIVYIPAQPQKQPDVKKKQRKLPQPRRALQQQDQACDCDMVD